MNEFDEAVLAIVKGQSLKDSIRRLYEAGEIDDCQLGECVVRELITLPEYNDIIEGADG